MELVTEIYKVSESFPESEQYSLTNRFVGRNRDANIDSGETKIYKRQGDIWHHEGNRRNCENVKWFK